MEVTAPETPANDNKQSTTATTTTTMSSSTEGNSVAGTDTPTDKKQAFAAPDNASASAAQNNSVTDSTKKESVSSFRPIYLNPLSKFRRRMPLRMHFRLFQLVNILIR